MAGIRDGIVIGGVDVQVLHLHCLPQPEQVRFWDGVCEEEVKQPLDHVVKAFRRLGDLLKAHREDLIRTRVPVEIHHEVNGLRHERPEGHETLQRAHRHYLGPRGHTQDAVLLSPVMIAVGRDEHVLRLANGMGSPDGQRADGRRALGRQEVLGAAQVVPLYGHVQAVGARGSVIRCGKVAVRVHVPAAGERGI